MNEDEAAWLDKADRSITAAKTLLTLNLLEAAVSRRYYAMFYVATALLLRKGLRFSKHSAVIAAFGQHFAKTGEAPTELHRYLIDAEEDREEADYSLATTLTEADATIHIDHAEQFLELGRVFLSAPPGDPTA